MKYVTKKNLHKCKHMFEYEQFDGSIRSSYTNMGFKEIASDNGRIIIKGGIFR